MRKLAILTAAALCALAACCVWGYRFVDARFEGSWPPSDWEIKKEGSGDWYWEWGPWNAAGSVADAPGRAELWSKSFNPGANNLVYYRFDAYRDKEPYSSQGKFALYYADPPVAVFHSRDIERPYRKWYVISGTVVPALNRPVRAVFSIAGGGRGFLNVDNVVLMDREPEPAVSPASLGRVKALFR
jgi:hypothetical protein